METGCSEIYKKDDKESDSVSDLIILFEDGKKIVYKSTQGHFKIRWYIDEEAVHFESSSQGSKFLHHLNFTTSYNFVLYGMSRGVSQK